MTHYIDSSATDINFLKGEVRICKNSFIGVGTIICNSVRIGCNSIVGAGSVVTKNIPDNEVWAGNPARFIKNAIITKKNLSMRFLYLGPPSILDKVPSHWLNGAVEMEKKCFYNGLLLGSYAEGGYMLISLLGIFIFAIAYFY